MWSATGKANELSSHREKNRMEIVQIKGQKKDYLALLLLADEQESMIDRYLERGQMFAMKDGEKTLAVIVVTDEGGETLEIKNLAVSPDAQKRGYGRSMVGFVERHFAGRFHTLLVGTGDSPLTVPFYEKCGFVRSHVVRDFFTDNYDYPIVECGVVLRDMVYLKKRI